MTNHEKSGSIIYMMKIWLVRREDKIDWDEFIKPVRKEDEGKDLWSVFNVVQEKLIEGDFEYRMGGN